jgi:hypothetical protein
LFSFLSFFVFIFISFLFLVLLKQQVVSNNKVLPFCIKIAVDLCIDRWVEDVIDLFITTMSFYFSHFIHSSSFFLIHIILVLLLVF